MYLFVDKHAAHAIFHKEGLISTPQNIINTSKPELHITAIIILSIFNYQLK